jgi:hypothetical protein
LEEQYERVLANPEFSVQLFAQFKEEGKSAMSNLCYLIGSDQGWVLIRPRRIKGEVTPWLAGRWEDVLSFKKWDKKELEITFRHPETAKEVTARTYKQGITPTPKNSTLLWASLPADEFEPILQKIMNKRNARGGAVKTFDDDPRELLAVYLGGYGQPEDLAASEAAPLSFNSESLEINGAVFGWDQLVGFSVGGPGTFETGGGWIGGGFGIAGAIEGVLVSSVLNALTTKTHVLTEFVFIFENAEMNFATDRITPNELDMYLSPLRGLIRQGSKGSSAKKTSGGSKFCEQCGNQLSAKAKFCSGCGETVA